jgi:acetyl-CoA carboxylase carboxyltransferase component
MLRNSLLSVQRAALQSRTQFSTRQEARSLLELKNVFRKRLNDAKEQAQLGGGKARIDTQHARGKLTARERLSLLLDDGSFREYDMLKTHRCTEFGIADDQYYGDGVVTGHGTIFGRKVSR